MDSQSPRHAVVGVGFKPALKVPPFPKLVPDPKMRHRRGYWREGFIRVVWEALLTDIQVFCKVRK